MSSCLSVCFSICLFICAKQHTFTLPSPPQGAPGDPGASGLPGEPGSPVRSSQVLKNDSDYVNIFLHRDKLVHLDHQDLRDLLEHL